MGDFVSVAAFQTLNNMLLPPDTGVRVQGVEAHSSGGATVQLEHGQSIHARKAVVVATDGPAAQKLLGKVLNANPSKPEAGVGTCCLYFR